MTDADKLIEAVARAIYHADAQEISWETLCDLTEREGYIVAKVKHSVCMTHARAALSAIEAEGWAVVPMEPTDAMMFDSAGSRQDYRAMLYARPRITGGAE